MKRYQIILFDLDGTLTASARGITNSVAYALDKFGVKVSDKTTLHKFIGPPLMESFEEFYHFTREDAKMAVKYYREYYQDKGIFENEVYNGIEELLQNLQTKEKKLVVATSKPEVFARKILDYFGLTKYFTYIGGANLDGTRTEKWEVIQHVLDTCKIEDQSTVIMVGDREHDVFGAQRVGIDSIGVLFGYGNRKELESAKATYIAEQVGDIGRILIGL
ncbi:MAG: HAD family hydrolase [Lachnospiraceae bacterium]